MYHQITIILSICIIFKLKLSINKSYLLFLKITLDKVNNFDYLMSINNIYNISLSKQSRQLCLSLFNCKILLHDC